MHLSNIMMTNSSQRQIHDALKEQLIPWAKQGELLPLLARVPLQVPDSVGVIKIAQPFLGKPEQHPFAVNPERWPQLNLHACRYPALCFILEGEADVLLGLTRQRAASLQIPSHEPGLRALSLSRRHCCLFPPLTPYSDSRDLMWHRGDSKLAHYRALWLRIHPIGAFVHMARSQGTGHQETNTTLVTDSQLLVIAQLLMECAQELPQRTDIVHACLLALILCIERSWSTNQVLPPQALTNMKSSRTPQATAGYKVAETQSSDLHRACAYIRSHLSEHLSPQEIAVQTFVSVSQLKRLFHAEFQMPVMKYVLQSRMEEAQSLLAQTEITVEDVGCFCGYRHRTHFSRIFTATVGISPRAYRNQVRQRKTAS